MARRPWFELNDDRVVVVRIIVGLEPDLTEVCMQNRKTRGKKPCKLVIMTHENALPRFWASHGVVLYEERMDHDASGVIWCRPPCNILGIVPGPDQTETMKIQVDINWLSRVQGNYCHASNALEYFMGASLASFVSTYIGSKLLAFNVHSAMHVVHTPCAVVGLCWSIVRLFRYLKGYYEARKRYSRIYPCKRKSWKLPVPPQCSSVPIITPLLWNETMWLSCATSHARLNLTRLHRKYGTSSPPCDHRSMPRLLCSTVPFYCCYTPHKTPSGIIINEHPALLNPNIEKSDSPYYHILPDIHEYNNVPLRHQRISEFKEGALKKELIETVWHPSRVAQGLVSLDD